MRMHVCVCVKILVSARFKEKFQSDPNETFRMSSYMISQEAYCFSAPTFLQFLPHPPKRWSKINFGFSRIPGIPSIITKPNFRNGFPYDIPRSLLFDSPAPLPVFVPPQGQNCCNGHVCQTVSRWRFTRFDLYRQGRFRSIVMIVKSM